MLLSLCSVLIILAYVYHLLFTFIIIITSQDIGFHHKMARRKVLGHLHTTSCDCYYAIAFTFVVPIREPLILSGCPFCELYGLASTT